MRLQRSSAKRRSVGANGEATPAKARVAGRWGQLTVPRLGTAKSGRESKAPMVSTTVLSSCDFKVEDDIAEVFDNMK